MMNLLVSNPTMLTKTKKQLTLPKLLKKAQLVFNRWIRDRDKDKGCISCPSPEVSHASHYLNMGHYSALRFNEMNVNGACVKCNTFLHGNLIGYRQGLVKRYGEQKVLMLENSLRNRSVRKWSRVELMTIIEMYKIINP